MNRPIMLDLFSCAGGAGMGYHRAGFDVLAVDLEPQVNNPFPFHQGDALDVLERLASGAAVDFYDRAGEVTWLTGDRVAARHASPPCQLYSTTANAHDASDYPDLVEPTRIALQATGGAYVIENVEGAPLLNPLLLCGTMFGLRAPDVDGVTLALKRHRLFESNVWLMGAGGCAHDKTQIAGVYTGSYHKRPEHRDDPARRGGYTPAHSVRAALMGIDWMTEHELAQAIPPAMTEFIGAQLIRELEVAA